MHSPARRFDYQSDRHCSKTANFSELETPCLITSQIDTAPKLVRTEDVALRGLITSQIDTAPKQCEACPCGKPSLITSQIDTAPKPALLRLTNRIV